MADWKVIIYNYCAKAWEVQILHTPFKPLYGVFYFNQQLFTLNNIWSFINMSHEVLKLNLNNPPPIGEDLSPVHETANIIKEIVKSVLGYSSQPVSVSGNKEQLMAFTEIVQAEKKYMEEYSDPNSNEKKINELESVLEEKLENFQQQTKIEWPFR